VNQYKNHCVILSPLLCSSFYLKEILFNQSLQGFRVFKCNLVVQLNLIYQLKSILYDNACSLSEFDDLHFSAEYQYTDFIFQYVE